MMKRPEIVVLSNKNFQFINKAHSESTFWESLWRTYLQLTGCVFVVGCMRYGEGNKGKHVTFRLVTCVKEIHLVPIFVKSRAICML